MALLFLYLVKSDAIVSTLYSSAYWNSHFYKVPEQHSHVNLVTLYLKQRVILYETFPLKKKNIFSCPLFESWVSAVFSWSCEV